MEAEDIKKSMMECLKDDDVQSLLLGKMEAIVAKAVAAKDWEIAELRDAELRRTNDQLNELLLLCCCDVPPCSGEL